MLNPGNCHFMLFGVKENEQFDLMCNDITLKHSSQKKILGVTIDSTLSFDEHSNNICKTANKILNAFSRINHYMKQNHNKILLSLFIISHSSYCPLIWMFCSKKSTKMINSVYERSLLRIILNDCESPYSLLLEEAHQIIFHQLCINSLMVEVYKDLNEHSPDIMKIFNLRENMYNLRNFHIFQTEDPHSLKHGLDAIPCRASQLE